MDLVDSKYIGLISSRLQKFKKVKADLYNFRCPICGDSQKNKNKTRGYLYQVKNNTNFKCHNCGASMSLNNFLKTLDPTKPVFKKSIDLPKASTNQVAREYLENRKLDPDKFYYADKFKQWTNSQKKTFDNIGRDDPRIIIPMYNEEKNLIGFQGRALDKSPNKYITIMINEEAPKIYGLETINTKLPIYVVEGPFDSTFIDNSVALCGSDGDLGHLKESDLIFVYDNEPRNREIVRRIEGCISRNERVVIWPSNVIEKDINDMVLAGHDVQSVLKLNTYRGLEAKIKFNNWKKI